MRYRVLLKYKDPEYHPAYFYRYLPALRFYQKMVMQSDVHFQYRENGQWFTSLPPLREKVKEESWPPGKRS